MMPDPQPLEAREPGCLGSQDAAENLRPEGEEEPGRHAVSALSPPGWRGMGREGVCVPDMISSIGPLGRTFGMKDKFFVCSIQYGGH